VSPLCHMAERRLQTLCTTATMRHFPYGPPYFNPAITSANQLVHSQLRVEYSGSKVRNIGVLFILHKTEASNHRSIVAYVPNQHRHCSCRPHDELHLAIEHFQWPMHGPGIYIAFRRQIKNCCFRHLSAMTEHVPVVTVAVTADM